MNIGLKDQTNLQSQQHIQDNHPTDNTPIAENTLLPVYEDDDDVWGFCCPCCLAR